MPLISGLVPCNVIAEEILTDHPARYRAMIVESANPAHSLADSQRFREALAALDLVVVIDVAMTETARLAHYVLPASTQYEKWEATFFNFEFPRNVFHLRAPLLEPPDGPLPEPEIHARLVEALGAVTEEVLAPLREAAGHGRAAFAMAFFAAVGANPRTGRGRAGGALPHARPDPARRRGRRRRAVGRRPQVRPGQPRGRAPGRLHRRGPRSRRATVRGDPVQPVGRGDHRRRVRRVVAPGQARRTG